MLSTNLSMIWSPLVVLCIKKKPTLRPNWSTSSFPFAYDSRPFQKALETVSLFSLLHPSPAAFNQVSLLPSCTNSFLTGNGLFLLLITSTIYSSSSHLSTPHLSVQSFESTYCETNSYQFYWPSFDWLFTCRPNSIVSNRSTSADAIGYSPTFARFFFCSSTVIGRSPDTEALKLIVSSGHRPPTRRSPFSRPTLCWFTAFRILCF